MASACEQLTGKVTDPNRYDIPHAEIHDLQIAAMDERFQERRIASSWSGTAPPNRA
jgi:hypothetical protein